MGTQKNNKKQIAKKSSTLQKWFQIRDPGASKVQQNCHFFASFYTPGTIPAKSNSKYENRIPSNVLSLFPKVPGTQKTSLFGPKIYPGIQFVSKMGIQKNSKKQIAKKSSTLQKWSRIRDPGASKVQQNCFFVSFCTPETIPAKSTSKV
jgi:hypothetical protein